MKISSMKILLLCYFMLSFFVFSFAQTGKYFTVSEGKCKNAKVFVDHRIQQFADNGIRITWDGNCVNGFASGNGTLFIYCETKSDGKYGVLYEGNLVAGKKSGQGWLVGYDPLVGAAINEQKPFMPLISRYEYRGNFKNDEFDGYGEFITKYPYPLPSSPTENDQKLSKRLRLYMPFWRTDIYFSEYKGDFTNGKIADTQNGKGKTKRMGRIGDMVEYTGPVKNGKPHGKGFAVELDITGFPPILPNEKKRVSYNGDFVYGELEGNGKETNGYSEYEGEFRNNIWNGKGKLTVYEWAPEKPGSYKYSKKLSVVLDGNFKEGFANGFCTIYYQNSAAYKYTGPMKDGEMEGTGEIEYLDGSKFRGNFRNGKREGMGAVQFADGDKFSGEYMNDKPVSGTMYYYDGAKYEGGFTSVEEVDRSGKKINMYKRHGSGKMTEKDGRIYNVSCNYDNCTETN